MKWVFWASTAVIAYTYVGYAGWLWLRRRWRCQLVKSAPYEPVVSIVMVVRNEAHVLERKLRNLLKLDYPAEQYEIVVVSDGSTDATNDILSHYAGNQQVRVVLNLESRGKASGLNDAIEVARGEVIVFTDARKIIKSKGVRLLEEKIDKQEEGGG